MPSINIDDALQLLKGHPELVGVILVLFIMVVAVGLLVSKFIRYVTDAETRAKAERELMAERTIENQKEWRETFTSVTDKLGAVVDRNTEMTMKVVEHCASVNGRNGTHAKV